MIEKRCHLIVDPNQGGLFQLVHPGYGEGPGFIKQGEASGPAQEHLRSFLRSLAPDPGKIFTLISALGAGEYYGSNSNGDYFPEAALIHVPQGWYGMSHRMQKAMGAKWEWGYPTFYNANVFQHHKNQDPKRAFGSIEYSYWDPLMKRVLLICAFDRNKARLEGADGVIDKLESGQFPSVSMGARVPYDLCSITTDWSRITGNFRRDLAEHRRKPIRGLSVTTSDYSSQLMFERGKIYPDGRKVFMWNLHPRFFDLSVVFIGADKTSYILAKLAGQCPLRPEKQQCRGGCHDCAFGSTQSLSL
jgi:hypothetical protein